MPDHPADQSGKDHDGVIERCNPAGGSALVCEDNQHLTQRHRDPDATEEKPFPMVGVFHFAMQMEPRQPKRRGSNKTESDEGVRFSKAG